MEDTYYHPNIFTIVSKKGEYVQFHEFDLVCQACDNMPTWL